MSEKHIILTSQIKKASQLIQDIKFWLFSDGSHLFDLGLFVFIWGSVIRHILDR